MKGLLVIDAQNAIIESKDFQPELANIEKIIKDFKNENLPVIFVRNISDKEDSPFYKQSKSSKIYSPLEKHADTMIEKKTPSSFYQTSLQIELEKLEVTHIFITGFNTEFCCQFTSIAAYDRGYQVTFIENATGTVNDETTYEMEGLDIRDFVGTVLYWSNVIEVLDMDEYNEYYDRSFLNE